MRSEAFAVLLLVSTSAAPQSTLPPPPEEPVVIIDEAVCVSCGWLVKDEELALLKAQAMKGNAEAAFRVGLHYSSADQPEAHRDWSRRAAHMGHPTAQYHEWFLLVQAGNCVRHQEALAWLEKAAAQSYAAAVEQLPSYRITARSCASGQGTPSGVPPNSSSKPTPLRGAA